MRINALTRIVSSFGLLLSFLICSQSDARQSHAMIGYFFDHFDNVKISAYSKNKEGSQPLIEIDITGNLRDQTKTAFKYSASGESFQSALKKHLATVLSFSNQSIRDFELEIRENILQRLNHELMSHMRFDVFLSLSNSDQFKVTFTYREEHPKSAKDRDLNQALSNAFY